jgi:ParB-like chromosome segregation protein Spo0J
MSEKQIEIKYVSVSELKPHPKNYRAHPDDQLEHIIQSIKDNGHYRNVVVAQDNIILAGHGVVKASSKMGLESIPVVQLDVPHDDPKAIKVLTGDNEIAHLGLVDDRLLTELLKEVKDYDMNGLLGTGYDDAMLASLVMVTRPKSEIEDFDAAAEWVGMPEHQSEAKPLQIIVSFDSEKDREDFGKLVGSPLTEKTKSIWFPHKEQDDVASVRLEA